MNNNERQILAFGTTDTCKTALEGRIVRAHNALAYCWLFCFLTVSIFIFYLLFFIRIFVLTDPSADCYDLASWSEIAVVLIHWHQISHIQRIKSLSAKSWTKIWHFVPTKIEQILAVLRVWGSVVLKRSDFYSKRHVLAWTHVVWAILRQNRLRGVTSRSVGKKESRGDPNRNDMSPLTQGLNYRSNLSSSRNPILEPNITSVDKPVAKLWPFLYIQDSRQPPTCILSNRNSAIRSADPENPGLEPCMEWIGCTVCKIFAFKLYCDL